MPFNMTLADIVCECADGPYTAADLADRLAVAAKQRDSQAIVPDRGFKEALPRALAKLAEVGWLQQDRNSDGIPVYKSSQEQVSGAVADESLRKTSVRDFS